jgi:hypothetical protein
VTRFNPDFRGLGELLRSQEMQTAMRATASKIAEAARATAPVDSGEYRDSFEVSSGVRESPSRRAYGRVINETPYAASVEFGNSQGSPAQHVLGRSIDAAKD